MRTPLTDVVLEVDRVAVSYGRAVALHDVSLQVPRGAAVALLGANGAGKTTTIRAIAGLLGLHGAKVTSGSVRFNGDDLTVAPSHQVARRGIAHVPEGRLIFPDLTVEENLSLGETARTTGSADKTREQLLELFPVLADRYKQLGGYLSGGEQQMLAISRALMAGPSLLLLDEVSLGLAPLITRDIFHSLAQIRGELDMSMLLVEQNAKLALEFADYAYVLESGRVTHAAPSEELRNEPKIAHLYLGGDPTDDTRLGVRIRDGKRSVEL